MIDESTRELNIRGYGEGTGVGRAKLIQFDRAARLKRAATGLLLAWGAAVAALFIPVAHLVLVPGAILFGLYIFRARLTERSRVLLLEGDCPDCNTPQRFDYAGTFDPPLQVTCASCGRSLSARPRS